MTTIGYGDISPDSGSIHEIILTIIGEVLGTTLFAYVIGALIHLIKDFDPGRRMRTQNLLFLNQVYIFVCVCVCVFVCLPTSYYYCYCYYYYYYYYYY
jgi:uncharacterized membrane protein